VEVAADQTDPLIPITPDTIVVGKDVVDDANTAGIQSPNTLRPLDIAINFEGSSSGISIQKACYTITADEALQGSALDGTDW